MTLSDSDIDAAVGELDGWERDGDVLTKRFEFADFPAAMDFMARCAERIDELDHHPEWTNVYNRVEVSLTSHDVGGITERDLRLARILDAEAAV